MKLPYVKTNIQIRFTDLDPLGHVSNSVYMQYFDMGRIDFFKTLAAAEGNVPGNVVASIHIDMLHEIRLADLVHVETWCTEIGNKSMKVEQHIFANDICVTQGVLVLVGFDRGTRESVQLPRHWKPSELPIKSLLDLV